MGRTRLLYHCVILLFPAPCLPPLPWLATAWGHCQGSAERQRLKCTATSVASRRHLGFIRGPKIGFGGVKSVWRKGWGRKEGGRGRKGAAFEDQRRAVTKLFLLLRSHRPSKAPPDTPGPCREESFPGLAVASDAQSTPFSSRLSERCSGTEITRATQAAPRPGFKTSALSISQHKDKCSSLL